MDDNFDIYGDLDEALIAPLQEEVCKIEAIKIEENNLKNENERILAKLNNDNRQLKENMSSLLATASSEIDRKDLQIRALRREMDDIIFRKAKVIRKKTAEKYTQTPIINSQQRFTQTSQVVDNLSLEKLFSKDKREKSPRSYRDRWRKDEPPKKLSNREDKYNNSRNKSPERSYKRDKSRHQRDRNKSSNERTSSKEKDRLRSKSPRRDRHRNEHNDRKSSKDKDTLENKSDKKIDENDLRFRLLKKKKSVEITEITNESNKIIVKSIENVSSVDHHEENDLRLRFEADVNRFVDLKKELERKEQITQEQVIEEEVIIEEQVVIEEQVIEEEIIIEEKISDPDIYLIEKEQIPNMVEETNNEEIYVRLEMPLNDENLNGENVRDDRINSIEELAVQGILIEKQQESEEAHMKIEQVPLEVGPEYSFKQQNQPDEEVILELPMDSTIEEIIYDSRDLDENKISPANESFDSTKENSMNNSLDVDKKSKKRKIVTTEVESDGTVVFTITRKKKRKIAKS